VTASPRARAAARAIACGLLLLASALPFTVAVPRVAGELRHVYGDSPAPAAPAPTLASLPTDAGR
jgi:hypothetical protein